MRVAFLGDSPESFVLEGQIGKDPFSRQFDR